MKKIIISSFFAFLFFLTPNFLVGATDNDLSILSDEFEYPFLPNTYENQQYFVGSGHSGSTFLYLSTSNSEFRASRWGEVIYIYSTDKNPVEYSYYKLDPTGSSWIYTSKSSIYDNMNVGAFSNVKYVSTDLYNLDKSKIIFKKKSVPTPPVPSQLEEVMIQVNLEEVLSPILSLVGLVVSCLVSWMALRKSWTWLLSQLRSL